MQSIQTRLASGLLISLIILLSIQWLVVGFSIRYLTRDYISERLIHDADSIVSALTFTPKKPAILDTNKINPIYQKPYSGHYYKILVDDTEFRSRSLWDTELSLSKNIEKRYERSIVTGPQSQTLLKVATKYLKRKQTIYVVVAEDLTPVYQSIERFQIRHGLLSFAILLILLTLQIYIVRFNLKPLERARREVELLSEGYIQRLHDDVPVEIKPLVQEINQQLQLLARRLEKSRNATGNLAHTLKTQLSLLSQLTQSDHIRGNREVYKNLTSAIYDIEQLITRELKRARIAGGRLAGRQAALKPEVEALIATLQALYREKNLHIDYHIPENTRCAMDRQDLMELLGNIMDNACKWAKHKVSLTIHNEEGLTFIVEDDGPGCSAEQIASMTQRGTRLDEQTSGHGLGLSIVTDLAEDYGGKLEFSPSQQLGGLCVKISLPKTGSTI